MKKFFKFLAIALLALASLELASCGGTAVSESGTITDINVKTGDRTALLTWEDENVVNATVCYGFWKVSEGIENGHFWYYDYDTHFAKFSNLDNGETYGFIVYIQGNSTGKILSRETTYDFPYYSGSSVTDYVYDGSKEKSVIKLDKRTDVLKLKNIKGKSVTYVNYNKNREKVLDGNSVRKYAFLNAEQPPVSSSSTADSRSAVENETSLIRHFKAPASDTVKCEFNDNSAAVEQETFNKESPEVGQTKKIWVDQNVAMNRLAPEMFTLYAVCMKGPERKCFVWARASDVVDSGSKDGKISISSIQNLAKQYMQYYELEEAVYGNTYDFITVGESAANGGYYVKGQGDLYDYPTGTAVNIVLTDIGKDGISGKCGVVGYFWSKDYVTKEALQYSNEGKYFYMDIPFCNLNYDTGKAAYTGVKDEAGNEIISDTAISTLFHEYQHMILYGNKKDVTYDGDKDAWFNEMLSMLCEDLMQDAMGLKEKVQDGRIRNFNEAYILSGVAQYLRDGNSWASHATAYAFGSWLARNYGGAELITKMSNNKKFGIESIEEATTKQWDELMTEYLKACAFRPSYAASKGLPTHNKVPANTDASVTITSSMASIYTTKSTNFDGTAIKVYGKELTAELSSGINIWSDKYKNVYRNKDGSVTKYYGPDTYLIGWPIDVQPTGFIYHKIQTGLEETTPDELTLWFTPALNEDDEEVYIYIQDKCSPLEEDKTAEVK